MNGHGNVGKLNCVRMQEKWGFVGERDCASYENVHEKGDSMCLTEHKTICVKGEEAGCGWNRMVWDGWSSFCGVQGE